MLRWFLLSSKVNQQHMYTHHLFVGFPSHLGHHRMLVEFPVQVLISYLFY